ncbi:hypothetical protein FKG94_27400 [Exilibacterium tricleocarpae]|uniref:Uncharacterized protein n=1 Tax=Exilibacterium tricleocarpae TaxID=2591008 RepID=A0A545SMY8_9GAMM|nr:DUF6208 family protein [Exilibacterium tricleocarpae]TQV66321.1 hypothetical protein FKG94_27400 [Exilibacterium tricleocarpae]
MALKAEHIPIQPSVTRSSDKVGAGELLVDACEIFISMIFRAREVKKIKQNYAGSLQADDAWLVISGSQLKKNQKLLPFLMVSAPRWNVHAVIIASPVFSVKEKLGIETASLSRFSDLWNLSVIDVSTKQPVWSGISTRTRTKRVNVTLSPGAYRVVVRLYESTGDLDSPVLTLDSDRALPARRLDHDNNEFYSKMSMDNYAFYRRLNLFPIRLLKYRRYLKQDLLKRIFLPAADPGTQFEFGYLGFGKELDVRFDDFDFSKFRVYFCFYNEASFPVFWCAVEHKDFRYRAKTAAGCYLLRILSLEC